MTVSKRKTLIAVVGGGDERDRARLETAETIGRMIAERGWMLVAGGKGGIMEAASRGAAAAGGTVIGILPEADASRANEYVAIAIATGLGEARNAVIAACCQAMIAIGGEYGTLSEVALARKHGKPVIAIDSPWSNVPGVGAITGSCV